MQLNPVLQKYLAVHPFIEGIVILDKEAVEIAQAFVEEDSKLRTSPISIMYVAAVTACNDNLSKLSNTKTKSLTLIYDQNIVYLENWQHMILTIYCNDKANVGALKQLGGELKKLTQQYNETIEKQQK